MWFMDQIVSWLGSVTGYFKDAYQEVMGWVPPFYYLYLPLYWLYYAFFYLTFYFSEFNTWLDWVASRINSILSTWDIQSYFKWWFDAAQNAWSWVSNALYNVWNICNSWWSATKDTVLSWIADAKSWSLAQVNSLRDSVTAWVADLYSWTWAQVYTVRDTILSIITNVQAWTTTQINNTRDAILAVVSDLSAWTTTQLNTIQAALTTLVDWTAFTKWITNWWNNRLLDVQGLINSSFVVREGLWQGWQEWRGNVAEFFTDPYKWVYDRLDQFFERFW